MDLAINWKDFSCAPANAPEFAPIDTISYATSKCALGLILVARNPKGVCAISIGDDRIYLETDLAAAFPKAALIANLIAVEEDLAKVLHFLERPADGLQLALDIRGTPLQRRVWEKLRAISVGRTVTYMELARWITPFASPRVVARACAANRIALAIPCHRVIRSREDTCGYRWGAERKRELIKMEARVRSHVLAAASERRAETSDTCVSSAGLRGAD
jgi:methylated-DNA-[protein]-cysteine S-methyltransferase/AraC family transcriptional regulator of adaptative response/methylated-DNA-[protein]-cysteine methyltransferase